MTRIRFRSLILALAVGAFVSILFGCAATSGETMQTRLAAMSDGDLLSYYHGVTDRLKEIQEGARDAERQGVVPEGDQLSKMPYVIGGEAWALEQKRLCALRELNRRNLKP
jgi:hypothetical protein